MIFCSFYMPQIAYLVPECKSSILAASPFASLKSPVYNTVPFSPSNRNLQTATLGSNSSLNAGGETFKVLKGRT